MIRRLTAALGVLALLTVLALQQLVRINDAQMGMDSYLLAGLLVYSTLRLAGIAYAGRAHPVNMTFWIFVYIWCALAPLLQTLSNSFPRPHVHDRDAAVTGAVILWLGIISYEAGRFLLPRLGRHSEKLTTVEFSVRTTVILAFAACFTTLILIIVLGGPDALLGSRGDINRLLFGGREKGQALLLQSLLRGPPFIAMMALLYILTRYWRSLSLVNRRWLALALTLIVPVNLVANYPLALQRFWFGAIALTYLFSLARWTTLRPALYISLICIVLLALPAFDAFRKAGATETVSQSLSRSWARASGALFRGDYDAYQIMLNSVKYVREQDIMWGKNLFDSLFFWYPRRLYPTKHIGSGHHVSRYFGYRFTNVAAPLWMEAFLGFSFLGVIVIFFGYGMFTAYLDRAFAFYASHPELKGTAIWMGSFWAAYQIFLLRGDLLSGIAYMSCPLLLLVLLTRWKPRAIIISKQVQPQPMPPIARRGVR